jgi:hypothetical protein
VPLAAVPERRTPCTTRWCAQWWTGRVKESIITTAEPPGPESRAVRWIAGIVLSLLVLVLVALLAAVGFLALYNIPSNAPGMAAKAVCSAAFVAGRDEPAEALLEEALARSSSRHCATQAGSRAAGKASTTGVSMASPTSANR